MTISQWLNIAVNKLAGSIGTARLDAEVLLSFVLNKERGWMLAHPEHQLTTSQIKKLEKLVARRLKHEPVAYLTNRCEFYGREFYVDKNVLVPRPESETMIDLLKSFVSNHELKNVHIVDVGTGSGALAITAKLEIPNAVALATDIDTSCLKVARQNAKRHSAKIKFLHGDLLEPTKNIKTSQLIILANLPYVPNNYTVNQAAMTEPRQAIFGGPDGLDLYRRLFNQAKSTRPANTIILSESLPFQHRELKQIAAGFGFKQVAEEDFIQLFENT